MPVGTSESLSEKVDSGAWRHDEGAVTLALDFVSASNTLSSCESDQVLSSCATAVMSGSDHNQSGNDVGFVDQAAAVECESGSANIKTREHCF